MAERQGIVTEVTAPSGGKKQGTAKIGNRTVRFFWNAYESDGPSENRKRLEKASAEGFPVIAIGEEMPNPRGEGAPMFKVSEIKRAPEGTPAEASQNGSRGPSEAAGGEKQRFVGREPGMADYWTAMRWAYSCALDILKSGEGGPISLDEVQKLAGDVFSRSHVDALWKFEAIEVAGGVQESPDA